MDLEETLQREENSPVCGHRHRRPFFLRVLEKKSMSFGTFRYDNCNKNVFYQLDEDKFLLPFSVRDW